MYLFASPFFSLSCDAPVIAPSCRRMHTCEGGKVQKSTSKQQHEQHEQQQLSVRLAQGKEREGGGKCFLEKIPCDPPLRRSLALTRTVLGLLGGGFR